VLAILDLARLLLFKASEALVEEIEGHPDDWYFVRTAPAVCGIHVGTKIQAFGLQFPIQSLDIGFDRGALDQQAEITDGRVEQFVPNCFPTIDQLQSTCRGHRCSSE